jgi:hypothetical protein
MHRSNLDRRTGWRDQDLSSNSHFKVKEHEKW